MPGDDEADPDQDRLDQRRAEDAAGDAADRALGQEDEIGATRTHQPGGQRLGQPLARRAVGEQDAGDDDRGHEVEHAEAGAGDEREQPDAHRPAAAARCAARACPRLAVAWRQNWSSGAPITGQPASQPGGGGMVTPPRSSAPAIPATSSTRARDSMARGTISTRSRTMLTRVAARPSRSPSTWRSLA